MECDVIKTKHIEKVPKDRCNATDLKIDFTPH